MPITQTTIIISDLTREQTLTVPKMIKQEILEYQHNSSSPETPIIDHWSELPGLSRLVMIISTEALATQVYLLLRGLHPELKIHLSESIIPRHRSFDSNLQTPHTPDLNLYEEPSPAKSPTPSDESEGHDRASNKKVLLESLQLNTKLLPADDDQLKFSRRNSMSPTITLESFDFKH